MLSGAGPKLNFSISRHQFGLALVHAIQSRDAYAPIAGVEDRRWAPVGCGGSGHAGVGPMTAVSRDLTGKGRWGAAGIVGLVLPFGWRYVVISSPWLALTVAPARNPNHVSGCVSRHRAFATRLNAGLCSPCCFVATSMNFAVMSTAQWDCELITHLASKCSALCKSEVVRIGRMPTTNQTGMSCDRFHMLSIAHSSRLRMGRTALFDPLDIGSSGRLRSFPPEGRCRLVNRSKGQWPRLRTVAPSSSSANLAWNAFSNWRASAMFNAFLAGRIRRAQMAAASVELTSLSSLTSWSRSTADNWLLGVRCQN